MDSGVPIFKLYGEQRPWLTPDLLHYESIAQRSSLHDWEIKPHRHGDLYQFLYVQQGEAQLHIEDTMSSVQGGVVQWVPPLCVHGFRFSRDVEGSVLTLASPVISRFEQALGIPPAFGKAFRLSAGEDKRHLDTIFAALAQEYAHEAPGRELVLGAWVNLLLTWLQRQCMAQQAVASAPARGHQHFSRFSLLVERHFREQWPVQKYAGQLGISVVRLNALCHQLGNQTALQFIHQRLLLEAKRNLIYTAMTMAQISDSLGFSEPAYFSRFFRRMHGCSPNAFRQAGVAQLSTGPKRGPDSGREG
jgi:AraC family transcriptional activator of pobA